MNTVHTFSFSSATRAARAALQWRLLLLWVLGMLIPTAILGMTMLGMLQGQLDYSVHSADIARQMDMTVLSDLLVAHGRNSMAFNHAGVLALIATLLISPLLSGMAATAARARDVLGFRALLAGGGSEYPRMFRMMVWSIVPLGIAAAIGSAAMDAASDHAKTVILESDADLVSYLAMAAMALVLAIAHATLDAGRAALAIERRRTSAVKAWWCGCKLLLKRPLATFGVYFAISVIGLGLAAALTVGRINVAGSNLAGFIAALLLVQLTVAVIGWMRSARLFAMVELARCERG
ncbi:MAG: hypothetical protein V4631_01405 [Pseudomonadota bacterium]